MPARQLEILTSAASHVAPGGVLVYAVCSSEPEEGEGVVQQFLRKNPEFTLETELATFPEHLDEDAHYGARMRRGGT